MRQPGMFLLAWLAMACHVGAATVEGSGLYNSSTDVAQWNSTPPAELRASAWVQLTTSGSSSTIVWAGDDTATNHYMQLGVDASRYVYSRWRAGGSTTTDTTSLQVTVDEWHFVTVWQDTTDAWVCVDASCEDVTEISGVNSALDLDFGLLNNASPTARWPGNLSHMLVHSASYSKADLQQWTAEISRGRPMVGIFWQDSTSSAARSAGFPYGTSARQSRLYEHTRARVGGTQNQSQGSKSNVTVTPTGVGFTNTVPPKAVYHAGLP